MADNAISVSVVVNAPVERVWPLLIEQQEIDGLQLRERMHVQADPKGSPVAGQVIHTQSAFLHIKMCIDRVVPVDPPMTGQTVYARMSFLGKEGNMVAHLSRDVEHYHFQAQGEIKHPWFHLTGCTDMRCIAIDTTSCTIQRIERSELNIRLIPRWMTRILNSDKTVKKATADGIEKSLQEVKVKAERGQNEW